MGHSHNTGFNLLLPDLPAMIIRFLSFITAGPFWICKAWLLSLFAALSFSCVPTIFRDGVGWDDANPPLPPAYELKADQPLADTAELTIPEDPGARSHGAKLTPRVFSAGCLFIVKQLNLHPYLPASLGGCLFLLSGIISGYSITGDRKLALGVSLILAGLYASNACFSMNFEPKPFDGVAIGMVAVTLMLINRPILFSASAFLTCWTDERAIMSLVLIGITVFLLINMDTKVRQNRGWMLAGAILSYIISRKLLEAIWSPTDLSMLGENLLTSTAYFQLAGWSCFEGAWILLAMAVWKSWQNRSPLVSFGIVIVALGCIGSCLIVLDVSRASCFAFPLIFAALASLTPERKNEESPKSSEQTIKHSESRKRNSKVRKKAKPELSVQNHEKSNDFDANIAASQTNYLTGPVFLAALISLISTNWEIIMATVMSPCPSTLIWFIQYLAN
ncbi:MAG: hypothetical protein CBE00_12800 [Planctomycetaceae bacterium TMED240]|nr:hypothetical protein [Rhodopirellula sp.]OUX04219.1 MAG: hypothetical protein CBE00_12800 [Planctomycetaceae bacterium TMED240]